jgi:hypothetical protein
VAKFAGCAAREAHLRRTPKLLRTSRFAHNPAVVPTLQTSRFFEERYPGPAPVEGTFLQADFCMALFSDSVQRMEELISKSKKVRNGATLEEDEIDGSWLTTYATIARRCRDDKDLGVSRYPYELPPVVNPVAGGFVEHREWAIRPGHGTPLQPAPALPLRSPLHERSRVLDGFLRCHHSPTR